MANNHIPKVRCSDCDALVCHKGQPQRVRGTTMQSGFRYCMGCKRPRCFRNQDPKIYVPKWCPKRIEPAALRIYGFKNLSAQYMYAEFGLILEHRYIVRYTGTAFQSANAILKDGMPQDQWLADGEVLELDDGIRPVFLCKEGGKLQVTNFDKGRIQKNEL